MSMTNLEIQTMEAVKSASRAIVKHVDNQQKLGNVWEQRRYEIAKDVIAAFAVNGHNSVNHCVKVSVEIADKLIEELRKEAK